MDGLAELQIEKLYQLLQEKEKRIAALEEALQEAREKAQEMYMDGMLNTRMDETEAWGSFYNRLKELLDKVEGSDCGYCMGA